jgi:hypothetical protein
MYEITGQRFERQVWVRFSTPGVMAIAAALLLLAACGDDDSYDAVEQAAPAGTVAAESDPTPSPQDDAESTDTDEDQEGTEMTQPELQWSQPPAMQLQEGEQEGTAYLRLFREQSDAAHLRQFVREYAGAKWCQRVLGI